MSGPTGGSNLVFRTGGTNAAYGSALNRVLFTTAPGLANGILAPGGVAVVVDTNGVNFATYNTTGYATGANVGGIQAFQAYNNATVSSTTVVGSPVITVGSTFGLAVGMPVNGVGIPEGATIAAILTPTTYQLSTAATSAGTNAIQYQYTNINTAGVTGSASDVIRLAASGNVATGNTALLTRSAAGILINSTSPVTVNAAGFSTLTVSNAGLLVAGGTSGSPVTHSIGSNLVVFGPGGTYDFNLAVDANTTLDVQGVLRNSFNVTKSLPGTLQLSAKQYFNTGGNWFTVAAGKVILNAGDNTLYPGRNMAVGAGATLDLNGTTQTIGGLITPEGGRRYAGGVVTNSSATHANLVTNNGGNWFFGGVLSGNLSFLKAGGSHQVFQVPQTYTGSTYIGQTQLYLQDSGTLANTSSITVNKAELLIDNATATTTINDRVNDAAPITLSSG